MNDMVNDNGIGPMLTVREVACGLQSTVTKLLPPVAPLCHLRGKVREVIKNL